MNRKMLIIILSLCLVIGIGAAGTAMMTGGSDLIGSELSFNDEQVTLFRAPNGENSMVYDTAALPSPVTIIEEIKVDDGSVWYGVSADGWADVAEDYIYVRANDCTVIPAAAEENTEEPAIEAVELEDGDIVINSEDAQLSAEVVEDRTVAEIEDGLSLPEAEENVSRETYCFDIHAEEDAETTVSISGIATAGSKVKVYHMVDDSDYSKYEELPCTVEADGTVTFTTTSFSEFYFTVDFHNGDATYSIAGESSVLLSEVFSELNISENAYDAESVVFSDPSLISVERQADGDWLLTSLAAFSTEETLTITFSDGHEYVMRVTDGSLQSTNNAVKIGEFENSPLVIFNNYQVMGAEYNNGIDFEYGLLKSSTSLWPWKNYSMTLKLTYADSGRIVTGNCKPFWAIGTQITFTSSKYWFDVSSSKTSLGDTKTMIEFASASATGFPDTFEVIAYPLSICTKSDNQFCTVKQVSEASIDNTTRTVVVRYYDAFGNLNIVGEYTKLFPDRGDKINVDDIVVSEVDTTKFTVQKTVDGSTYYVTLIPSTYTVKAGIMSDDYGDKRGWGVTKVTVSGGLNPTSDSTKKEGSSGLASVKPLLNNKATVTAEVKDGYRFVGWYTSDSAGGKCVSTDQTYTFSSSTKDETITLYARAVEKSLLAVDCYVRLPNGLFINRSDWEATKNIYGADITKNYDATYEQYEHWYILASHRLVDIDRTATGQTVVREGIYELFGNDTNVVTVDTGNSKDTFYSDFKGKFENSYYNNKTQGHYDFSVCPYDYKGKHYEIPFTKAGIGLDLVSLNDVYYDAAEKSGATTLSGQTWKYGYQWNTYYWTYTIKNGWVKHSIQWAIEDIPVYEDEGRINFVYKLKAGDGSYSYYLKYHENIGGLVYNIPDDDSVTNIDVDDGYWFGISGLYPQRTQPVRAGYTFVGWSTNPNHNPKVIDDDLYTYDKYKASIEDGTLANCQIEVPCNRRNGGVLHLYAIWDSNKSTADVTFDLNYNDTDTGSTPNAYDNPIAVESKVWKTTTVNKGSICPDPGTPGRDDGTYRFDGWYYTRDCDPGTEYDSGNTKIYADTTVYAKWVPTYTVNYYKDSIASGNLLGSVTLDGENGQTIVLESGTEAGQLNYKKPTGYNDGVQQNEAEITAYKNNAVVNVLYTAANAQYTINYYKDSLSGTMLGSATGTAVLDTTISLTSEQLNAYKPASGYNDGALQDKNVTVKADGSSVVRVLYTAANAQYTIEYYKDSLSGTNLGTATLTGTIGSSISVAAGTGEGQLDYKRPAIGYKSGVQKTNASVNADGSSVVKVVYEADIVNYYIEAYVMNTAGKYPTTATYSKTMTANSGTLVTSASYQNPDAWSLKTGAFSYDTEAANVTSGTLNSSSDSAVVLKVYFARNQFAVNWIVTKDDDSSYELKGSTMYYYEQAVTPASVTTPEYYSFDNWAKGGVAWPSKMPANSVTVKGEFIRQRADLTITKNGMKSGETALFTVKGAGLGSGLTVMVQNGESVTIKGLAVGETYTVTENGWSWKYALPAPMESTIAATGSAVTFTNTPKDIHWLTDEFFVDNKFNA